MKRTIFCLTISVLFLIINVSAQNNSADSIIVMKSLEKMKKELNLNQEQVNSLIPLLLDNYEKNGMFKKNITVIRNVQEQNDQSTEYELSKILNPEQYKQYMQNKENIKAKKKDLRIREKMAFYRQELKLTDQQYNDLKILIETTSIQKEALKAKYKNNEGILKEEMKRIRKGFEEQLKKILNKEQLEKYKALHNTAKS